MNTDSCTVSKDANLKYICHIHRDGFCDVDPGASVKMASTRVLGYLLPGEGHKEKT